MKLALLRQTGNSVLVILSVFQWEKQQQFSVHLILMEDMFL